MEAREQADDACHEAKRLPPTMPLHHRKPCHGRHHHGTLQPGSGATAEPWRDALETMLKPRPTPRETTKAMVRAISRELGEIEQAIDRCRGDRVAEPRLTGICMADLLISSRELLQNLLIDTAQLPQRINEPG
jgi:hypothetical protein